MPEAPVAVKPAVDDPLGVADDGGTNLNIGVEHSCGSSLVPLGESRKEGLDDLDVLLRQRPPSIPRISRGERPVQPSSRYGIGERLRDPRGFSTEGSLWDQRFPNTRAAKRRGPLGSGRVEIRTVSSQTLRKCGYTCVRRGGSPESEAATPIGSTRERPRSPSAGRSHLADCVCTSAKRRRVERGYGLKPRRAVAWACLEMSEAAPGDAEERSGPPIRRKTAPNTDIGPTPSLTKAMRRDLKGKAPRGSRDGFRCVSKTAEWATAPALT